MTSPLSVNSVPSSNGNKNVHYIYNLPYAERQNLCFILDDLDIWADLAVNHMGYSKADLQVIRRAMSLGNSPSEELLNMWGDLNHTVTELFIVLYRMQQYTAMDAIKSFVDPKYHKLIMAGQPNLSDLLRKSNNTKSDKVLNCYSSSGISNSNNETRTSDSSSTISDENKNVTKGLNIRNVNEYASTIPQIDYGELVHATNNWSDTHVLGRGGFGTVFQGIWKHTAIAIKRITYSGPDGSQKVQIQQSLNELKHLNACRHDNILPLYGYSINGTEPCLVYQLMSGGSLEQRLNTKRCEPLTFDQRLNISCGTARGLQYLHTYREKPLIHGDIKPANILLDPCNQPKIGDFGLAREGPNTLNSSMEVSKVYGTKPYLPIEFLLYKSLSTKVDTYSFGVVLLEMFTGLRAFDKTRVHPLLTRHILNCDNVEDLIASNLRSSQDVENVCRRIINLGISCIADRTEHRPEMVMVLRQLENIK